MPLFIYFFIIPDNFIIVIYIIFDMSTLPPARCEHTPASSHSMPSHAGAANSPPSSASSHFHYAQESAHMPSERALLAEWSSAHAEPR